MSVYSLILAGGQTRLFSDISSMMISGNEWIPVDESIKYVQTEEIKITKNGTYYPNTGTFYSKVKVNIRKKKKGGSGSDNGDGEPTSKNVTISQVRTSVAFQGVQIITTNSTNGEIIKWIPKEDAGYYVKSEALNVSDNDIYIPDEGILYKSVTVNVEFDDDDPTPTDPDNPGGGDNPGSKTELKLITKNITTNGTYNAADEGVDGYSSINVDIKNGEFVPNSLKSINENMTYISYGGAYVGLPPNRRFWPYAFMDPITVNVKPYSGLGVIRENKTTYYAKDYPSRGREGYGKVGNINNAYKYENRCYDCFSAIAIAVKDTYQVQTIAPFHDLCSGLNNYLNSLNYSISGINDFIGTFDASGCDCFDCTIRGATDITTRENAFLSRESYCYRITITIRGFKLLQELPFMTTVIGPSDTYNKSPTNIRWNRYNTKAAVGYGAFAIKDGFEGVRQLTAEFRTKDKDELGRDPIASFDVFTKKSGEQSTLTKYNWPYIGMLEFEARGMGASGPTEKTLQFGTINALAA